MKIQLDNIFAQLYPSTGREEKLLKKLQKDMEVMAPGAVYMRSYKVWRKSKGKRGWNGRVNIIQDQYKFLTGLTPFILTKAPSKIIDNRKISKIKLNPITVNLRPYQKVTVRKCIQNTLPDGRWWPRGCLRLATGSGKTIVAAAMIQTINKPTMFIVHTKDLLFQAIDVFNSYNIETGILGAGKDNPNYDGLTVATVQTLWSMLHRGRLLEENIDNIEQLFIDEAHLTAASLKTGNIFVKVASLFSNAYMRWGLTATPFMKDSYSNCLLEGVTGKSLVEIKNKELIDAGYLTPPKIKIIESPWVKCKKSWPDCYDRGIVLNTERNKLIIEQVVTLPKPCLILVTQIPHGKLLQMAGEKIGLSIPFVNGQSELVERQNAINGIRNKSLPIVIATSIFKQGIDFPELRSLILASGEKSIISALQRIGRGMRLAKGKRVIEVIDFNDTSAPTLARHSKARLKVWEGEGFDIEV